MTTFPHDDAALWRGYADESGGLVRVQLHTGARISGELVETTREGVTLAAIHVHTPADDLASISADADADAPRWCFIPWWSVVLITEAASETSDPQQAARLKQWRLDL